MSDPIIKVDGLAKRYLVGHQSEREQYQSLRDTIVRSGKNFVRKAVDMAKGRQILMGDEVEEFWALKDISFDVSGAKSLVLSATTEPVKALFLKSSPALPNPPKAALLSTAASPLSSRSAPAFSPNSPAAKTFSSTEPSSA